jgi:hypothetical protein
LIDISSTLGRDSTQKKARFLSQNEDKWRCTEKKKKNLRIRVLGLWNSTTQKRMSFLSLKSNSLIEE